MPSPLVNSTPPRAGLCSYSWQGAVTGLALMLATSGCGGTSGASTADSAKANEMLSSITNAIEKKDWKTAETTATAAIEANALDSSQVEDARIARAQARIETGELEPAAEDLAFLENSDSPSKADEILVLKARHQLKSGNKAAAKKTFLMAKKINKKLKAPEGL